jgi:hypothetical protein
VDDAYAFVLSANIHRRHLTAEQRRELIAKLLKAQPEKSDRQIGKIINADNKTVAAVREKLEAREEIPHVETRTDSKGRAQPAKKKRRDVDDFLKEKREREAGSLGDQVVNWILDGALSEGDDDEAEVAPPEEIKSNIHDTIERQKAVWRAYKKIFRVADLDQASKDEVSAAIDTLISTLQFVQRDLKARKTHDEADRMARHD